jgi:hypothetical protein
MEGQSFLTRSLPDLLRDGDVSMRRCEERAVGAADETLDLGSSERSASKSPRCCVGRVLRHHGRRCGSVTCDCASEKFPSWSHTPTTVDVVNHGKGRSRNAGLGWTAQRWQRGGSKTLNF